MTSGRLTLAGWLRSGALATTAGGAGAGVGVVFFSAGIGDVTVAAVSFSGGVPFSPVVGTLTGRTDAGTVGVAGLGELDVGPGTLTTSGAGVGTSGFFGASGDVEGGIGAGTDVSGVLGAIGAGNGSDCPSSLLGGVFSSSFFSFGLTDPVPGETGIAIAGPGGETGVSFSFCSVVVVVGNFWVSFSFSVSGGT